MGIKERKEREKERRRQQIIVAAKKVFSEKGFSRATMEDIANEAELSSGTLYLYFKNKDELCASLTVRILQFLQMRVEHVKNEKELKPEQRLESLKDALYDVYEFDPLILRNMFHIHSSETIQNLSLELLDEIKKLAIKSIITVSKIFEIVIEEGFLVQSDSLRLSYVVWCAFSGLALWEESRKTFGYETSFKETFALAFHIIVNGLRNYPTNNQQM